MRKIVGLFGFFFENLLTTCALAYSPIALVQCNLGRNLKEIFSVILRAHVYRARCRFDNDNKLQYSFCDKLITIVYIRAQHILY